MIRMVVSPPNPPASDAFFSGNRVALQVGSRGVDAMIALYLADIFFYEDRKCAMTI
jgi:hypothetical protein